MPEIRRDPVTKEQVVIATERGKRPSDLRTSEEKSIEQEYADDCPFCAGNEDKTPPEIERLSEDGKWTVRVIPNKFPALSMKSNLDDEDSELFWKRNGIGVHEVIIENRKHNSSFFNMHSKEIIPIIKAYKQRYNELMNIELIRYVSIFKNYKKKAGASLEHTHSQVVAAPVIPQAIIEELHGSHEYYMKNNRCVYCDIINTELEKHKRIIMDDSNFIVMAPYASKYNYEVLIIPKDHSDNFGNINEGQLNSIANIFTKVYGGMCNLLGDFPFNMFIHSIPKGFDSNKQSYHWHIRIAPRLSVEAGLELGTGMYINTVSPEMAAETLREQL